MARVLIVDDSKLARAMLKGMLVGLGHEVIGEAEDVKPAIDMFKLLSPDLVTLDLVMPGGSGVEVLKAIMAVKPTTAVVMVTASGQGEIKQELVTMGAKAVLNKPFTADDLKTIVGGAAAVR
jgi:two-component system chemotaxis response regulator CheY